MLRMNRHLASAATSFLVGGRAPTQNLLSQHGNSALQGGGFGKLAAVPAGYGRPGWGLAPCNTAGGMSSFTLCIGTGFTSAIPAAGIGISGSTSGSGETTATISGLAIGSGISSGAAAISGSMIALGIISGESNGITDISGSIFAAVSILGLAEGSSSIYGDSSLAVSLSGLAEGLSTAYGYAAALINIYGTASGISSASADIVGAYFTSGTSNGVGNAEGGIATGLGWISAVAQGTCTVTLTPSALGFMSGSTGAQEQDGIDLNALADAVVSALNSTTIPVDTKKINGVTISGEGSAASPWGPA